MCQEAVPESLLQSGCSSERAQYIKMKGNETFKVAVRTLEDVARETLAAHHLTVDDLDLYVPHQANVRIIKAVAERLGLPFDKVVLNMDRYGNTSAGIDSHCP